VRILLIAALFSQSGSDLDALPLATAPAAATEASATARAGRGDPESGPSVGLAELEQLAALENPTLKQAIERFEQNRGRAVQAGAYPNPLIVWGGNNLGAQSTAGTQLGFFQQSIILGGKLRTNRARYEVDVEIARWEYVAQQLRVRNGVRLRFLEGLGQQRLIDLREALARYAEGVVRTTREKVETGHADEADLLSAQNEAAQIRLELDVTRNRDRNSWKEFAAYLGRPDMPKGRLEGSLEGEIRPMEWEPTLARQLAESPEIKVAELQIRRQRLTLKRELIQPIPDLIVRGGSAYDPTISQAVGYAQVYVDVPLWDRNEGNIHTARHGLREIEIDLGRIRLYLQERLSRVYNHHETSIDNLRHYREILPRARRALLLYHDGFRREKGGFSRVQTSQNTYFDAYVKYVEEMLELRRAEVAIEGYLLFEQSIEVDTLRPAASGRLSPPGEGLPQQSAGGGVPVGRPSRSGGA
jgi:cobalt-zinc-cadmium efflux system outer membrane protein